MNNPVCDDGSYSKLTSFTYDLENIGENAWKWKYNVYLESWNVMND